MTTPRIEHAAPLSTALRRLPAAFFSAVAAPSAAVVLGATGAASRVFGRPVTWFSVFMWGLAIHIAAIAFLFGTLGLPMGFVRAVAAWKEVAVLALFGVVMVRALMHRGPRTGLQPADMPMILLVAISLMVLATTDVWYVEQPRPIGMRLYGLREACFFALIYAIGRTTPELADDERVIRRLVLLGGVMSVIALLESAFLSANVLALLGATAYFQDFLGVKAMAEGGLYGLPHYYFTGVGGRTVQRSGALFLSSQGLAASFLLIIPAATLRMFAHRRRPSVGQWLLYVLLWAGLISSITRMTTMACILVVAALLVAVRRFDILAIFTAIGLAMMTAAMVFVPGVAGFVWETLTWQTLSSQSHILDWTRGFYTIAARPLGAGLGTADVTPAKYGFESLAGDNLLLRYGVELGIPGMLAMAAILVGIGFTAWTVFRRGGRMSHQSLGLLTLGVTLGLAINGITAVMLSFPFLTYLYFWLAGTVVTLREHVVNGE